jgi:hypothetical protein
MNENVKHLKYLVEVEAPYDNLNNVGSVLNNLPFVKGVTTLDSDSTVGSDCTSIKQDVELYLSL